MEFACAVESDLDSLPSLLLVDDNPTFCQVLGSALEKRGFAVSVAHDVERAKSVAQGDSPEYVIVDLKLPGLSGLHLIQELKSLDEQTCIVVLTGYASIATAVEAIKLGATHYLAKPVNADESASIKRMPAPYSRLASNQCEPRSLSITRRTQSQ